MKKIRHFIPILLSLLFFSYRAAPYSFTLVVLESYTFITSGNPATLTVNIPESGFSQATDSSTTYSITSNKSQNKSLKITGAITSGGNMPTNTSLTLRLGSSSGTSLGAIALSTTSVDLVKNLPSLITETGIITYTFTVQNGWKIAAQNLSRAITLTLTSSN